MVTAFVRNPSNFNISDPNLLIVQGNATDASAVKKAILGHDAVISTLGANTGLRKTTILHENDAKYRSGYEGTAGIADCLHGFGGN